MFRAVLFGVLVLDAILFSAMVLCAVD